MPKDRINISTGYCCQGCGRDWWLVYQGYNRCECGAYLWIEQRETDDQLRTEHSGRYRYRQAGIAARIPRLDAGDGMKRNGNISPTTFIDRLIKKNELGQPFKLFAFQREILELAFAFDENGKLSYDTILYTCPKKSGKTTINGALTLWWALTRPPNTCLLLANDREQTLSLVYSTIEGLIQYNPSFTPNARCSRERSIARTAPRSGRCRASIPPRREQPWLDVMG